MAMYRCGSNSGGVTPTSITPSNATPAAMSSGEIYQATASGYAIASYDSKTPDDTTPPSVTSGEIVKMGGAGYLYATEQSGAPTLSQLLYNANKTLLGSITTYNGSYTATQDCVMYAYGKGSGSYSPYIYFNDVVSFFSNCSSGTGYELYIGFTSASSTTPDAYGVFVPKGTTVKTRDRSGHTYRVSFYTLD